MGKTGNAIESFLEQLTEDLHDGHLDHFLNDKGVKLEAIVENMDNFIDVGRISQLEEISSNNFDLTRLIQLCKEVNIAYPQNCFYATAMLTRAILDHVPPIFSFKSFAEVANNYAGTKSFRASIKNLENSSRNISDASLHTQIRNKEILITRTQINFSNDLDVLLGEIVRLLKN